MIRENPDAVQQTLIEMMQYGVLDDLSPKARKNVQKAVLLLDELKGREKFDA